MTLPFIGTLTTLDLFLGGLLLFFAAWGAWKGLVLTLFQTAAWVAGGVCAWAATWALPPLLHANLVGVPTFGLQAFTGMLGFFAGFIAVRLLGRVLNSAVNGSGLSGANRLGGAILGAAKILVLSALVLFALQILPVQGSLKELRNSSQSYRIWLVIHPKAK